MPLVDLLFDHVGLHLVGLFVKSAGAHTHATRYPEAIPLRSITAQALAKELLVVCSRLGFPKEVLTDQGMNFMGQILKEMWKLLAGRAVNTLVYHPQTNGLVEIFNRTLKGMLRKLITDRPKQWHTL